MIEGVFDWCGEDNLTGSGGVDVGSRVWSRLEWEVCCLGWDPER